ncbi:MAG: hypothetical protein LUQ38_02635 [Methanotrichaceae archaeon]|nr:hypothetical protein [Methanotrichaceae archaeon]
MEGSAVLNLIGFNSSVLPESNLSTWTINHSTPLLTDWNSSKESQTEPYYPPNSSLTGWTRPNFRAGYQSVYGTQMGNLTPMILLNSRLPINLSNIPFVCDII